MRKLAVLMALSVVATGPSPVLASTQQAEVVGSAMTASPIVAGPSADGVPTTVECPESPVVTQYMQCLVAGQVVTIPTSSGGTATLASARPRSSSGSTSTIRYYSYERLTTGPDGQPCVSTGYAPIGTQPNDATTLDPSSQQILDAHNMTPLEYPPCPPRPSVPGEPAQTETPSMIARRYWETVVLPRPKPTIAPGRAITGKRAYLETRGEVFRTFSFSTPLGQLEILATGQYTVSWGDGEQSGPYGMEGVPWPDGQLHHEYLRVGLYEIVVSEQWTATWKLAGERGVLRRLGTSGRIDDFPVEQIQAVIGR